MKIIPSVKDYEKLVMRDTICVHLIVVGHVKY